MFLLKFLGKNTLEWKEFKTEHSKPLEGGWFNLRPIRFIFQNDTGRTLLRSKSWGSFIFL